ncbi:PLDc N-terminal domain-containing protein [Thermococcus sp. 5-4]|uniref:PLDc N-terminal domain-containing protein n=1 Tax=Thermococcus sp. 5-4 TaxID=2008440 RepID=UPI001D052E50|nr:PLDc N-terminal domain-containing protein [Thermococcus sp. 5-4]
MIFGAVGVLGTFLMVLQLLALVWVIYDVLTKQKRMPDVEKVIWIVLAFISTILGALVYYILVKRQGKYEEKPEEAGASEDSVRVY